VAIDWESRRAAEASIAGFEDDPSGRGFLACVEPTSVTTERLSVMFSSARTPNGTVTQSAPRSSSRLLNSARWPVKEMAE
jgi:hypothetical protein